MSFPEIVVDAAPFKAAVSWAAKWLTSRASVPAWAGLLVSVEYDSNGTDRLTVSAYSENATARVSVPLDDADDDAPSAPDSVLVSGRLLAGLADTLGKGDVELAWRENSQSEGHGELVMRQGRWEVTLPCMDLGLYPALPVPGEPIATIAADVLTAAAKRVTVAASRNENQSTVFWTSCLRFDGAAGSLSMTCTDRDRVATQAVRYRPQEERRDAQVLPYAKPFAEAASSFAGEETVTIGLGPGSLSLAGDTRSVVMTVSAEKWPEAMIGGALVFEPDQAATVARTDLALPVKRAAIANGRGDGKLPVPIRLLFGAGVIGVGGKGDGGSADAVDAECAPDADVLVGMNPEYFTDALSTAPGDVVRIGFGDPRKPLVLTCDADPAWRHVVMPRKLLN